MGPNGSGKTNLLESLCISSGHSTFRPMHADNLIQNGASVAHMRCELLERQLDFETQVQLKRGEKTQFLLQRKKSNIAQISKHFPSVLFSPESLADIKESSDLRRELLDHLLVFMEPSNADLIANFRKCLRVRNRVLKNLTHPTLSKSENLAVLDSLNPSYFQLGVELTWRRVRALRAIAKDFEICCKKLFPDQENVDISVEYSFSEQVVNDFTREKLEKTIYDRMQQLRTAEISYGSSLVGPHKHQIKFLYNQNDSRFFCSQGQQRALILAFKMAQIVYHRNAYGSDPVLFLDDVLSELDEVRRQALISFLAECEAQVFVTTTDFNLPDNLSLELGKRECKVHHLNGRSE